MPKQNSFTHQVFHPSNCYSCKMWLLQLPWLTYPPFHGWMNTWTVTGQSLLTQLPLPTPAPTNSLHFLCLCAGWSPSLTPPCLLLPPACHCLPSTANLTLWLPPLSDRQKQSSYQVAVVPAKGDRSQCWVGKQTNELGMGERQWAKWGNAVYKHGWWGQSLRHVAN